MSDYPLADKYGFHTPLGSDYISSGDDEISFNANRAGYWLDYVQNRSLTLLPEATVSVDDMGTPGFLGMTSVIADTDPGTPFGFRSRCMVLNMFDGFTYVQKIFERERAREAHRTLNPATGLWNEWQESDTPGALGELQGKLKEASNTPVDFVILGDSNIEGMGATVLDDRWINRFQAFANRANGAGAGAQFPFIPASYNHSIPGQQVTRSGNVGVGSLNFGFGWRAAQISDDTGVVTFTFTGTSAKLMLVHGATAGIAKITVNGSAPYTIDGYSTAGTLPQVHLVEGISSGTNTVSVQRDTATPAGRAVFLEGILTYNGDESSGVRAIDAGFSGRKAADVTTTRAANFARDVALLPNTAAVVVNLLTNDVTAGTPVASYKAALLSIVTMLRGVGYKSPVIFLTPAKGAAQARPDIAKYVKVLAEISQETPGVILLDSGQLLPEITESRSNISELGYFADSLHFANAGHLAYAGLALEMIRNYN